MNNLFDLCNVARRISLFWDVRNKLITLYLVGWITMSSVSASAASVEKTMIIVGTIYSAIPCIINENQPILGKFDEVITTEIDGSYRTITLGYTLDCKRSGMNELRLKIQGVPANFDSSALAVPSHENLGIALKADSKKLAINTWYNFDRNTKPLLQAVLIKKSGGVLEGGTFSSSATMMVDYQ